METPLTPLDFARRARRLYPDRLAVVDGPVRFTYREFFGRCDRWSAALQQLGVRKCRGQPHQREGAQQRHADPFSRGLSALSASRP